MTAMQASHRTESEISLRSGFVIGCLAQQHTDATQLGKPVLADIASL